MAQKPCTLLLTLPQKSLLSLVRTAQIALVTSMILSKPLLMDKQLSAKESLLCRTVQDLSLEEMQRTQSA